MKLLKCPACSGEMEIIDNERTINKKAKCLVCGFNNIGEAFPKKTEVIVIKRRPASE